MPKSPPEWTEEEAGGGVGGTPFVPPLHASNTPLGFHAAAVTVDCLRDWGGARS
jgi:hypothetical protein